MFSAVLISVLLGSTFASAQYPQESPQKWNFTTIRDSAHIFWWLYYTTADVEIPTQRPLVIWLQGGPGASSTGFGNFGEIGMQDADLKPRNNSWVQYVNVLFVDNPVGSGFSYVDDPKSYAKNNSQIAQDFVEFLKEFFISVPEFQTVPLYIFGESYGGKMVPEIALAISKAKNNGKILINLKGIVLGDPWVSPIDSVLTWASYLFNLGIVDDVGYNSILQTANEVKTAFDKENYELATDKWLESEIVMESVTNQVDFYNVLNRRKPIPISKLLDTKLILGVDPDMRKKLTNLMNNKVRQALNISNTWFYQNDLVFKNLYKDFMKPVTSIVEEILNTTEIKVTVYCGQLDLIVSTPGTLKWVKALNFKNKEEWQSTTRSGFVSNEYYEGYVKKYKNFAFYWIERSGHYVRRWLGGPKLVAISFKKYTFMWYRLRVSFGCTMKKKVKTITTSAELSLNQV